MKEQDIQKEVINIPIRSLLESIAHGLILSYCISMNSTHTHTHTHTHIKDITTHNKRSLLGCFEKGNKYH